MPPMTLKLVLLVDSFAIGSGHLKRWLIEWENHVGMSTADSDVTTGVTSACQHFNPSNQPMAMENNILCGGNKHHHQNRLLI